MDPVSERLDGPEWREVRLINASPLTIGAKQEVAHRGQVVGVAHTFVEVWENVSALLAELDVLLGFAELAVNAPTPYVRPTMLPTDAGEIVLIGALIAAALSSSSSA